MSPTYTFTQAGTYDLNGTYANFNVYGCDCSNGNIVLSMQQAVGSGIYYNNKNLSKLKYINYCSICGRCN